MSCFPGSVFGSDHAHMHDRSIPLTLNCMYLIDARALINNDWFAVHVDMLIILFPQMTLNPLKLTQQDPVFDTCPLVLPRQTI